MYTVCVRCVAILLYAFVRLLRLKRRYRDVMNTLVVLLPQLLRYVRGMGWDGVGGSRCKDGELNGALVHVFLTMHIAVTTTPLTTHCLILYPLLFFTTVCHLCFSAFFLPAPLHFTYSVPPSLQYWPTLMHYFLRICHHWYGGLS